MPQNKSPAKVSQIYRAECWCQEDVAEKAFDLMVTGVPQHPAWRCLFLWAMMKAQVDARKLPSLGCCGFLLCGFLLAQEWRFAVWLLGTVGQCSQSSVCSLACRAPRVSLAPEGIQTKRHHCLTHWSCSPTHSSFFVLDGGTFLFLGEGSQKETSFLKTGPQDNKTAVVQSYVFFFSQFKCHFELLLVVMCFFLFALCFLSPFV